VLRQRMLMAKLNGLADNALAPRSLRTRIGKQQRQSLPQSRLPPSRSCRLVGFQVGAVHAVGCGRSRKERSALIGFQHRLTLWSMTTGTHIPATTPEPLRCEAPRPGTRRHDRKQDPLSVLVRHLARQAARQMFGDADNLDGGQIDPPDFALGDREAA
jgi:hypothetical protein